MLDSIGRRIGMSELPCVRAILIQLLVVVDLVVEGGIVDM